MILPIQILIHLKTEGSGLHSRPRSCDPNLTELSQLCLASTVLHSLPIHTYVCVSLHINVIHTYCCTVVPTHYYTYYKPSPQCDPFVWQNLRLVGTSGEGGRHWIAQQTWSGEDFGSNPIFSSVLVSLVHTVSDGRLV